LLKASDSFKPYLMSLISSKADLMYLDKDKRYSMAFGEESTHIPLAICTLTYRLCFQSNLY
jgi:hypothetical protein